MNLFGEAERKRVKRVIEDPAFEIFRKEFDSAMAPDMYEGSVGDFAQLSRLRWRLNIGTLSVPPQWERACNNYMATPQGSYSLKDLCARYAVFVRSPLDRFNKPVGVGDESGAQRQLRANKDAVRRTLDVIAGQAGGDVRGDADGGKDSVVSRTAVRLERKRNQKSIRDSGEKI